jgi:hypothetical protein
MSYPRLAIFLALTIVGSLLQIWVVIIIRGMMGRGIDFVEVFSDGSLFFFSTTLVFGSWFSLLVSERDQTSQSPSVAISIICVGLVTVLSIAMYSFAETQALQAKVNALQAQIVAMHAQQGGPSAPLTLPQSQASQFSGALYFSAQLACAVVAVIYTFYVSALLGLFNKSAAPPAETHTPAVTEHV